MAVDYRKYYVVKIDNFEVSEATRFDLIRFELKNDIEQLVREYQDYLDFWDKDREENHIVDIETWNRKDGSKRYVIKDSYYDEPNGGHLIIKRSIIKVKRWMNEDGTKWKTVAIPVK